MSALHCAVSVAQLLTCGSSMRTKCLLAEEYRAANISELRTQRVGFLPLHQYLCIKHNTSIVKFYSYIVVIIYW